MQNGPGENCEPCGRKIQVGHHISPDTNVTSGNLDLNVQSKILTPWRKLLGKEK